MKLNINRRTRSRGFTLIELLVVLVILGMLAGLVGPRLFSNVDKSKVKTAETQVKMLRGSLQTYRLDVGSYPSTEQGLAALMRKPSDVSNWQGPYLEDELPKDPWSNAYVYKSPVDNLQGFALYSLGADGKPGGDGLDADVGYLEK
ncbi:type II secretion system major pseudopilin GspG [Stutzerimonas stutzeri]|uniref:type II secretion system major pseudopilin GspG n=1 Tax=Stutzerimonas stutzeri TaxID=316 RepID=UPI001EF605C5|nr:type II secretion system major pseudopilin GspG [Stutzerimonas stutzeri]CAB5527020.1 PilD-dependent protein pddA [Stutzerimonas stutzeri]CAB5537470.1 PilD-dependent protein pddA [Stutzerimonas stutzeri]CAC9076210.1 PilD-dependent protein pddA [Stutzerimonas stutzeri]